MALPFPNVPYAPGVPQIPRSPAFPPDQTPSISPPAPAGTLWGQPSAKAIWGVFDPTGIRAIDADSIVDFDVRNETKISDFPVQAGGFATYNKVLLPYDIQIRVSKAGTATDRATFLNQIDAVWQSLALYTVMTPERSYINLNCERYEITRRGGQGAYFLTDVDLFFRQIIQVTAQYTTTVVDTSNAQQPSDQPVQSAGSVQAVAASQAAALQAVYAIPLNLGP